MKRRGLAITALLATAASWGATFTLIKNVLATIAPEPYIFYRFTLAGLILLGFAMARRRLSAALIRPALLLGVLVFLGYWMQTRGLLLISPSRSAFLTGLYVVMVPFCDAVVYRVHVTLRAWTASVLAVAGTAAMIGGFDTRPSWGDLLTIACAVAFAFHVVLSARFSSSHSATGLAAIQVLFVGILAAPAAMISAKTVMTREIVAVILFTAIVTTALAFAALMWAQAHVSATEAAIILAFEPVAASLTSIMWYREPITGSFVAGALLILAAMIVSQLRQPASVTMRPDGANPRHE